MPNDWRTPRTYAMAIFLCALFSKVSAQVDCTPLDPRAEISKKKEAELQLSADTAFKIAKASGTLKGAAQSKILALPPESKPTEQTLIRMRSLYIFCGMVANAKDLSTTQKFNLYKELLQLQPATTRPVGQNSSVRSDGGPKPFSVKKAFLTSDENMKQFGQAAGGVGIDVSGTYSAERQVLRLNIHRLRINVDQWDRASAYVGVAPGCGESFMPRYVAEVHELYKYEAKKGLLEGVVEQRDIELEFKFDEPRSVAGLRIIVVGNYPNFGYCGESARLQ